ncbi:hypothetical protein H6G76_03225 [Nostoc sp. FACHB-152]|uniref:hypothetical protein n=1 Tax=unclassified Nostoc TaxID=2593658 RepID=UPI0016891CB4|nr:MULTISPECIES: hypothetical protein [unclassified Nostoc]MBD2446184.1 hypothetical protein [Nostoc sp. FACHB-152]MBD2467416.1 hypothetical protein [Nostoc sp. FACHB-145]
MTSLSPDTILRTQITPMRKKPTSHEISFLLKTSRVSLLLLNTYSSFSLIKPAAMSSS